MVWPIDRLDERRRRQARMRSAAPPGVARVLTIVDDRPGGRQALARVRGLPLSRGARVSVLCVVSEAPRGRPPVNLLGSDEVASWAAMAQEAARREGRADVTFESLLAVGEPRDAIAGYALRRAVELIVVGRSRGIPGSWTCQCNPVDVVERTGLPVLVATGESALPFCRVVVAVDLTDRSMSLVHLAARLVESEQIALVHALHVPWRTFMGQRCLAELRRDAELRMQELLRSLPYPKPETRLRADTPETALIAEAVLGGADLVVAGTPSHSSAISRALRASLARWATHELPCDILLGHSFETNQTSRRLRTIG